MQRMAGALQQTLSVIIRPRHSYPESLRAWFGSEQMLPAHPRTVLSGVGVSMLTRGLAAPKSQTILLYI